jgi:uncharacterized membrane protein
MQRIINRNTVFVLVIALASSVLMWMPDLFKSPYARDEERYVGRVVDTDNSRVVQYGIVKSGVQGVRARIQEGPFAGREVDATNVLIGKMESDKMFRAGDRVFLVLTTSGDEILSATAYDHYRLTTELLLLVLFAVLLCVLAGWRGLKALLSFFFAILAMWKILVPGILLGLDPVLIALLTVTAIAGVTLFSVTGLGRTGLVAWLGSVLGTGVTAALAWILFPAFRFHGAIQPYAETLLYSGFESLNLERLFIAAVFLGASGAVIGLSVDVSASMAEISKKRPDLTCMELTRSGLEVCRPMATTMVTTLLMAYMSEYVALVMVLFSKGIPPLQIININYISAEVLKTVVGSFGILTVAPFTAAVGGLLFGRSAKAAIIPEGGTFSPGAVGEIRD